MDGAWSRAAIGTNRPGAADMTTRNTGDEAATLNRVATWEDRLSPISDESIGGYTIWVPTSMVMIAAIILVLNGWNRAEQRRAAPMERPSHPDAPVQFGGTRIP